MVTLQLIWFIVCRNSLGPYQVYRWLLGIDHCWHPTPKGWAAQWRYRQNDMIWFKRVKFSIPAARRWPYCKQNAIFSNNCCPEQYNFMRIKRVSYLSNFKNVHFKVSARALEPSLVTWASHMTWNRPGCSADIPLRMHLTLGAGHWTPGMGQRALGTRHRAWNTEHWTLNTGLGTLEVIAFNRN